MDKAHMTQIPVFQLKVKQQIKNPLSKFKVMIIQNE